MSENYSLVFGGIVFWSVDKKRSLYYVLEYNHTIARISTRKYGVARCKMQYITNILYVQPSSCTNLVKSRGFSHPLNTHVSRSASLSRSIRSVTSSDVPRVNNYACVKNQPQTFVPSPLTIKRY